MRRVQSQAATASHHAAAFDEDLAIAAALVHAAGQWLAPGGDHIEPPPGELTDAARLLIRYDPGETGGAGGGIPGSIVSQLNFVLSRWGMTRSQLNARCRALYAKGWRPAAASVQETGIGRQKGLTVVVNGSGADCAGET